MEHGTMSEVHVIATLIAKILPFYYPDLTYEDEGAHVIRRNEAPFILVSPDGSLGKINLDGMVFHFHSLGVISNVPHLPNTRHLYTMRYQ